MAAKLIKKSIRLVSLAIKFKFRDDTFFQVKVKTALSESSLRVNIIGSEQDMISIILSM